MKRFCFLLLLPFFQWLNAQIPGMVNFNQDHGLSSGFNYVISQDKNGIIWLGSDNGVFRFDGKEFKQYSDREGLKNIEVLNPICLNDGTVFFFPSITGAALLKNDRIITDNNSSELRKIDFKNSIGDYTLDQQSGRLYLYPVTDPHAIYALINGKVETYKILLPVSSNTPKPAFIVLFFDAKTGHLFIKNKYKKGQIYKYNIFNKKWTLVHLPQFDDTEGATNFQKYKLLTKMQGPKFVLSVVTFSKKGDPIEVDQIKVSDYYYPVIDSHDGIWHAKSSGGVTYFGTVSNHRSTPIEFLKDYIINYVFRDREGNVWFSTKNAGLFLLPKVNFESYIKTPISGNDKNINLLSYNNTSLFLGMNNSRVGVLKRGTSRIHEYTIVENQKHECRGFIADDKNIIFGNAQNTYFNSLNTMGSSPWILSDDFFGCKNIVQTANKEVLYCSNVGLVKINLETQKGKLISPLRCYSACKWGVDSYFLGTFSDVYLLKNTFTPPVKILENCYLTDIVKVDNNLYAGASASKGILFFNQSGLVSQLNTSNGLPSNRINRIVVETPQCLWASSQIGLIRVEKRGKRYSCRLFNRFDGLPSNKVNDCEIIKDSIFIATSKGLGIFSLKELISSKRATLAKVNIDWVLAGKQKIYDFSKPIQLTTPDNDLKIKMSYPDYLSLGSIRFRYKVEGLMDRWEETSSNTLLLSALAPGNYILKVKGISQDGTLSKSETAIKFIVVPRFWQTLWFIVLAVLIGVLIIFSVVYRWFEKQRARKMRVLLYEKKAAELELQAIKAQINPHFIYNCLNSIKFLLYSNDLIKTNQYLDSFSKMIRQTLAYSEKTFITIDEEIDYLTMFLKMERLRFQEGFDFTVSKHSSVDSNWPVPSLLIQPFVENALKHGIGNLTNRRGLLEIYFEYEQPYLTVLIKDNGNGIPEEDVIFNNIESFGIKLSQKRIETFKMLFKTEIQIELVNLSQSGQTGTSVKVIIKRNENET